MTDRDYIMKLKELLTRLSKYNPADQDHIEDYNKIIKEIRLLDARWLWEFLLYD